VLFASLARAAGPGTAAALLTGMGADGARGLLALRESGAFTVAEHASTCVVYGMPREAVALGAAVVVAPLGEVAGLLLRA
jgi:two-component system chemotaxis response regulator CheB